MMRRFMRRNDDGYTMVMVLLAFFLVTGLALVSLAAATRTSKSSRGSQDYRAAMSAAQAGVQDYITRLNTCDTYWDAPCGTSTPNAALAGFATIPGTTGTNAAQYKQELLSNPLSSSTPGVVRLKVTGKVNGVQRVIVTDLAKTGFLKFLYYSDYETFSPYSTAARLSDRPAVAGKGRTVGQNKTVTLDDGTVVTAVATNLSASRSYTLLAPSENEVRAGCQTYYYDGRATFPRKVQWKEGIVTKTAVIWPTSTSGFPNTWLLSDFQCLTINFTSSDVIDGPLHTNDAMSLNGDPTFKNKATTSWPASGVTVPAGANLWYGSGTPLVNKPVRADKQEMPPTNNNIRKMADGTLGGQGCLYTGPTRIEMKADGTMNVKSPYTKSTNPGCIGSNPATFSNVPGPANGVIYVQDVPAATTDPNYVLANLNCGSAQPISEFTNGTGDPYTCSAGDAFVQGTVKGRFTIASSHDIVVTNNILYKSGVGGTDVLGLVAQNNVAVYHPATESTRLSDLQIYAAIASVRNSFTVQNYGVGSAMGNLTVKGAIVQKFRGPVGTGNGVTTSTGYSKAYSYDSRLMTIPPPSFLELQNDAWTTTGFTEQDGH